MSLPTVVCIGGFPKHDNDHTAEVWYQNVKVKAFPDHKSAQCFANHLKRFEREYGVEDTIKYAKSARKSEWSR